MRNSGRGPSGEQPLTFAAGMKSLILRAICLGCIDEGTNVARPITVNIPHKLGKQEARRRIDEGFGRLRQQMSGGIGFVATFQERWEGERLHFEGNGLGQKMTGRLDVFDDVVRVELDLPEILAAMADLITGRLQKEGQKLLEKK
jgi:hypothetical protein